MESAYAELKAKWKTEGQTEKEAILKTRAMASLRDNPKGAGRESILLSIENTDSVGDVMEYSEGNWRAADKVVDESRLTAYDTMLPREKAIEDLYDLSVRQKSARSDRYEMVREKRTRDALGKLRYPRLAELEHFRRVAAYLSEERSKSVETRGQGNIGLTAQPWHADQIAFLEESAAALGIKLDAENEGWKMCRYGKLASKQTVSLMANLVRLLSPEQMKEVKRVLESKAPTRSPVPAVSDRIKHTARPLGERQEGRFFL